MKYRNKKLTKIQKHIRKFSRAVQSLCSKAGMTVKGREPRWRQLKKARAKYGRKKTL